MTLETPAWDFCADRSVDAGEEEDIAEGDVLESVYSVGVLDRCTRLGRGIGVTVERIA